MKAIVKTRPEPGLELKEVEEPNISADQILIEVKAASVCGSDVHIDDWTPGFQFMPLPLIIGHEFSGQVAEVGANIKDLQNGDRVACNPITYCGKCSQCRAGKINICGEAGVLGIIRDGAFAKYVLIPDKIGGLYKLPKNITYEHAALLEPYCVAFHAYETSRVRSGDSVVVIGTGPIGLMLAQIMKFAGVANVVLTGLRSDNYRLEVGKGLGADLTVNVEEENLTEVIKDMTHGEGVDAVFEASGSPNAYTQALEIVRNGGEVIGIGISPRNSSVNFTDVVRREINLKGIRMYTSSSWERVITLLSLGKIQMDPFISQKLPLHNFIEGFESVRQKKAIKIVLVP